MRDVTPGHGDAGTRGRGENENENKKDLAAQVFVCSYVVSS